eukprot:jgi/Botrbrau1/6712/Bobra.0324s0003.1
MQLTELHTSPAWEVGAERKTTHLDPWNRILLSARALYAPQANSSGAFTPAQTRPVPLAVREQLLDNKHLLSVHKQTGATMVAAQARQKGEGGGGDPPYTPVSNMPSRQGTQAISHRGIPSYRLTLITLLGSSRS